MSDADYIIVGSGINALVCAAMLGRKGRRVLVLERNDRIGGCIRTEEITAPGFIHDVMATTFVLFITSPGYAVLGPELQKRGVIFADCDLPTGVLLPDGRHAVLTKNRARNIAALDALTAGDGASFAGQMDRIRRQCRAGVWSSRRITVVACDRAPLAARGLEARSTRARGFFWRGLSDGACAS